jgi:hypothetical protein
VPSWEKVPEEGRTIVFCSASQNAISGVFAGFVQLRPRLVQTSRLHFALVSNDNAKRVNFDVRTNPVCTLIIASHLDRDSPYTTLLTSTSVRPTLALIPLSSTSLASSLALADTKSVLQPVLQPG